MTPDTPFSQHEFFARPSAACAAEIIKLEFTFKLRWISVASGVADVTCSFHTSQTRKSPIGQNQNLGAKSAIRLFWRTSGLMFDSRRSRKTLAIHRSAIGYLQKLLAKGFFIQVLAETQAILTWDAFHMTQD